MIVIQFESAKYQHKCFIFRLPEWVKNISQYTNDTLEQIVGTHFEAMTHSNEMKKIKGGVLIREMLKRFKEKSLSRLRPDHSIWVYSAHDTTLANILNTLNVYEVIEFSYRLFMSAYNFNSISVAHTSVCIKHIFRII